MNDGTKHGKLNFAGYPGYYNYMSYYQGYGGFQWYADFFYMNQSTWTGSGGIGYQNGWCDTGYQNEAAMSNATSLGFIYQYGLMESTNGHTFTLVSMNAAASFSRNAVWNLTSYTENNGSLYPKATDKLKISYTGEHVNLSTLGNAGDFQNIAAVSFQLVSYGHPGNSCTYGYPTAGAQLAIGDLKVTWSKKADLPNGPLSTPYLLHHAALGIPHATAERAGAHEGPGHSSGQDAAGALHSGHVSDAASQFHLPSTEHFF